VDRHTAALDFLGAVGGAGAPTEELYRVALGDESSGRVGDPDLEFRLELGAGLDALVQLDRPAATDDEYISNYEAAVERLNLEEERF
jgi:hypothetical protein